MSSSLLRRSCAALTSLALAGSVALLVPASAEAATTVRAYGGTAYGSTAKFGTSVNSGRTANTPLCTTKAPVANTNDTAEVNLEGLGTIGATTTKVESKRSGSTQSSTATTTVAGVELLGSQVTADAITVVAKSIFRNGAYERQGSTTFVGLRVAGVLVPDQTPAANTELNIPLVGRVILNQQSTSDAFRNHVQTVTGLRVIVTADVPLIGAGQAQIGYAEATLHSPTLARAYGNAYATKVQAGDLLSSGPTAIVYLPCGGTAGATRTSNIAGIELPPVLGIGAAQTAGKSVENGTSTNATTTARIADLDLLDGVVTADAIFAKASVTRTGSKLTRSSAGTTIADLRINGTSVPVPTGTNRQVPVPGVGTLFVNRAISTSTGLQVYALQLQLTTGSGPLASGTVINIGAANAGVDS